MKWIKDHIIELIALLVSFASVIISLATGLANAFRCEPFALLAWSIFLLVLGVATGWLLRGLSVALCSSSLQILRGRRAIEYIENQPDVFKEIIREAFGNGGVCYELISDSEMRILAARGFFEAPDVHNDIFECAWALKPKVIKMIKRHPECLLVDEYGDS